MRPTTHLVKAPKHPFQILILPVAMSLLDRVCCLSRSGERAKKQVAARSAHAAPRRKSCALSVNLLDFPAVARHLLSKRAMDLLTSVDGHVVLSIEGLDALLRLLRDEGYRLIGPTVRDGAIVSTEIQGIDDLPAGVTEEQDAGTYRLKARDDGALFGYSVGPESFKRQLFVPRRTLFQVRRKDGGMVVDPGAAEPHKIALIGARACDIHAIAVQDKVFLQGSFTDDDYARRREGVFTVAVNCGQAGGTCFCTSMGTGPEVTKGFDVALTELVDGEHRFLAQAGTERGRALLAKLGACAASERERAEAKEIVERTAASMRRTVDTTKIRDLLMGSLEHPRWDEVAKRCLSCANCTMVCPTCFCSQVEDTTDLSGETAERSRRWDSCFTLDHSYVHGGSVRSTVRARYRQWLTHKFAGWIDQFGTSGCVGCGRCVTWCPAAIDVTEELAAIRATGGEEGP